MYLSSEFNFLIVKLGYVFMLLVIQSLIKLSHIINTNPFQNKFNDNKNNSNSKKYNNADTPPTASSISH